VIPAAFAYRRAESTAHAIEMLVGYGEDAKVIAGGHSLLPIMKLRLATPAVLVDIGRVHELSYINDEGSEIAIGALTKHWEVETSPLLSAQVPLLRHAAGAVGDCQIRHRGTIGGAVSHGDPAADIPAALMALRATVVLEGTHGRRTLPIDDFYLGFLDTALTAEEVLVELRVPKAGNLPWGFQKFRRRSIDWAVVGIAYQGGAQPGIGLVNMGSTTLRAAAAETALQGGATTDEVASLADKETAPVEDASASPAYRRHLSRVLLGRALAGEVTS
jgi:carbon-monoxide dehydrogenase medium subunit